MKSITDMRHHGEEGTVYGCGDRYPFVADATLTANECMKAFKGLEK